VHASPRIDAASPLAPGGDGGTSTVLTGPVRGTVLAGTIGSVLEWYDFAVYGYLAPIIGTLFFPSNDPVSSLLAAFGVFAIGFLARPVGGLVFGQIGDRLGRKPALLISVVIMGVATLLIGLLPTHARIGPAAGILLVIMRLAEGLSVGGEYTGSIVLLAEHAPARQRGFYAVWPEFGCVIGFLLGSGIAGLVSGALGHERMVAWGWRVPFLLGSIIAVWGIVFRRQMAESPGMEGAPAAARAGGLASLAGYWRTIVRMVCLLLMQSVGFYLMFVYAASYLTQRMHVSTARALDINTLGLVAILLSVVPAAIVSDHVGRKPLLYVLTIAMVVLAYPLWWLINQGTFAAILTGQVGFAILIGFAAGSTPAAMSEMLPPEIRCTGVGVGYNLCLGLFGGTAPLVATYLVARTSADFVPAYYVMAVAALSFVAVLGLPETAGKRAA
jgi:MFS transporter, MHS family, proline/betaine transporter